MFKTDLLLPVLRRAALRVQGGLRGGGCWQQGVWLSVPAAGQ